MEKCVCGREYNSPEWMAHHKDACAVAQEAEKPTCSNGQHKRIEVTCLDCIEKLRADRDAALLQISEMQKALSNFGGTLLTDSHTKISPRVQKSLDALVPFMANPGDVIKTMLDATNKPESDCTCLFLLNGIHATGCPKCTGEPGVIPVDTEKRP